MTYRYFAYGMAIESELPIPQLPPTTKSPEIEIKLGSANRRIHPIQARTAFGKANASEVLISLSSIGHFHINSGKLITVEPAPESVPECVTHAILSICIPAVVFQRGRLALNACVVKSDKTCVAITGGPATGKSTVAAAMCKAGFTVLADDTAAIETICQKPFVYNSHPYLKLWESSLRALETPYDTRNPIRPGLRKYYLKSTEDTEIGPNRISHIIHLENRQSNSNVFTPTFGINKIKWIQSALHCQGFLSAFFASDSSLLLNVLQLAKSCDFHTLQFPRKLDSLKQTTEEILRKIGH